MTEGKLKPIDSDIGDLMTMKEFIDRVENGLFIDYDGFGQYADPLRGVMLDDFDNLVKPSHVKKGLIKKGWTHIIWYNK